MSCGHCPQCTNRCDVCIDCNAECNEQQSFCTGSGEKGQLANAYLGAANAPSIVRDDIIIEKLPQATLNRLINHINSAGSYGTHPSGNPNIEVETRAFIYASKIQEILSGLTTVSSENTITLPHPVAPDAVIYAEDFNILMTAINDLKLSTEACNDCITNCDVNCDTCNTCDGCISCVSCESVSSYSSHYSSHYSSCDTPST